MYKGSFISMERGNQTVRLAAEQAIMYKAFGLRIRSEMDLPELAEAMQSDLAPDIVIRLGESTEALESYDHTFILDGKLFVNIRNTALYCIDNGHSITITPAAGAMPSKVRLYLLGSCMGAILMQRGIFPLHGSAVVLHGKAYVMIGESGAGKSTLAAALRAQGGTLLSDDVVAVTFDSDNKPLVAASYPQQKLWHESLLRFDLNPNDYRSVLPNEAKYAVPVAEGWHSGCVPLGGIYELQKTDRVDRAEIRPVKKLEQLHLILYHTYRHSLIKRMNLTEWQFATAASMLRSVKVKRLFRPAHRFTADELALAIILDSKEDN